MEKVQDDALLVALLRPIMRAVLYVPFFLFLSSIHPRLNPPFVTVREWRIFSTTLLTCSRKILDYLLDSVTGFMRGEAETYLKGLPSDLGRLVKQGILPISALHHF